MAEIGVLLTLLGLTVALPGIGGSTLGPWFCYRLAPPSITSAITPCMYPCLFISPHEHPHIVVHSEVDGTPCKVSSGLHHETKVGRCRSGVCSGNMGPPVLKRKKRFICLITLAKLLQARKERKLLRRELEQLRKLTLLNNLRGVNRLSAGSVIHDNLNTMRGQGYRGSSANTADPNVVEIHLITNGGGGSGAHSTGTGISESIDFGNSVGGSNLAANGRSGVPGDTGVGNTRNLRTNDGRNDVANYRIGDDGRESFPPNSDDVSGNTGRGRARVVGRGPGTSETRIVANIDVGNDRAGGALGGNAMTTVVSTSADNAGSAGERMGGHSGTDLANRGVLATSSSASGRRNNVATVVGITGVGVTTDMSGRRHPGIVRHEGPGAVAGNVVGVGGVISASAAGGRNNVRLGAGSAGASYLGRRTSNFPGIGGARSSFPSSYGGSSAGMAGTGRGIDLERSSPRGNGFFVRRGGTGHSFYSDRFWDDDFRRGDDFGTLDGF